MPVRSAGPILDPWSQSLHLNKTAHWTHQEVLEILISLVHITPRVLPGLGTFESTSAALMGPG